MEQMLHKHVTEGNTDSIEIGTPGKGGVVKIYVDFSDPATCIQKIRVAAEMKKLANDVIMEGKAVDKLGIAIKESKEGTEVERKKV